MREEGLLPVPPIGLTHLPVPAAKARLTLGLTQLLPLTKWVTKVDLKVLSRLFPVRTFQLS